MPLSEPPPAEDPMLPAREFSGQTAVVTGGGSGVGLAAALGFARCGANVAIIGRSADRLEGAAERIRRDTGATVLAVPADVRDADAIDQAFRRCEDQLGVPCMLANHAGVNFPVRAEQLSANGWRAVTDIVLDGVFFCSQAFHRRLAARGDSGVILNNLASYAWSGFPGDVHAAAAKAGVANLTRTLAGEWARDGIRVNSLVIGTYAHPDTPRYDPARPDGARGETVPARRGLRQQELGWASVFLCSRYAGYMTGAHLVIDGGDRLRRGLLKPAFASPAAREHLWLG